MTSRAEEVNSILVLRKSISDDVASAIGVTSVGVNVGVVRNELVNCVICEEVLLTKLKLGVKMSTIVLEVEEGLGIIVDIVSSVGCGTENDSRLVVEARKLESDKSGVKTLIERESSEVGRGTRRIFELVDSLENKVVGVGVMKSTSEELSTNKGTNDEVKMSMKMDDGVGVGSSDSDENVNCEV